MAKISISILALVMIILIAGCIGGQEKNVVVTANDGIVINSFTTIPSLTEAISGDTVTFDLEIENTGGTTARNVEVELYGIEGQWRNADGSVIDSTLKKSFGTLKPPLPERNIPGDFRMVQWNLMTPPIAQGLKLPLTITARVTYDYNTSGFLQITAVNENEYERMRIEGKSPDAPIIQNSNGPIKLDVPTADQYRYIVVSTEEDEFTYPFRIIFTNVGSGFPLSEGRGGKITGTIELLGSGVEFDDCFGVSGGKKINLDDSDIPLKLRDSNSVPISCSIKFDSSVWKDKPMDTVTFVFNLFYRYHVDEKVTITVIGR